MPHGRTNFPSKGRCIYCYRDDVKLTDEHIVPYFIGGQHVILEASCKDCAVITSKFELDVGRGMWADPRVAYDAPSRRKKRRKKHILIPDPYIPSRSHKVLAADYPSPFGFYHMAEKAGILQGLQVDNDISGKWKMIMLVDGEKSKVFEKKYGFPLTAKFKHVPNSFGRLIVKIGYGQALTLLDIEDFQQICVPFILTKNSNVSFILGGREDIPDPYPDLGYHLGSAAFGTLDRVMIISEVRLLANNQSPLYHIVVGEVIGKKNVSHVLNKLGKEGIDIIRTDKKELNKDAHCLPSVWPLPYWGV